ncbi:MAG TPA: LptF/LptG family permease, partial [Candidatus Nitrosotalea sp.]|nr:LptF/LptG family permease [Candidatus Nitrosotalea sp.]
MKTLHLYLTRQVLAALALTVAVFTFVLVLSNVLREILFLLVNGQATIGLVFEAVGLLIPYLLAFALPMGMLTATLLVFGRFSADQELTAVRASGVSLLALITPVLLIGVAMSCVAGLVNLYLAPRSHDAYKNLIFRVGRTRPTVLIQENRFIDDFPGYGLFVRKKSDTNLQEVLIYKVQDSRLESLIHAARAQLVPATTNNVIKLRLFDVDQQNFVGSSAQHAEEMTVSFEFKALKAPVWKTDLGEMTFPDLRDKLRELEQLTVHGKPVEHATNEQLREQMRQLASAKADLTSMVRVKIHRQVALSFAPIAFTLIGIPLGVRA